RRVQAVRSSGLADHDRSLMARAQGQGHEGTKARNKSDLFSCFRVFVATGFAASSMACSAAPSTTSAAAKSASNPQLATLELSYDKPALVGAAAHAAAAGLPAGTPVDLTWGTVTGGWAIEDYSHFRGKKYSETAPSLGQ